MQERYRGTVDQGWGNRRFSRELSRIELIALDGIMAIGYICVLFLFARDDPSSWGSVVDTLVVVAVGAPLIMRRLWPVTVFAVALSAAIVAVALDVVRSPALGAAFALYTVALMCPRPPRNVMLGMLGGSLVVLIGCIYIGVAGISTQVPYWILLSGVAGGVSWTLGQVVREYRAASAQATAQLSQCSLIDERIQIARDLHDIVSHTLSLIGVKAGATHHGPHSSHDHTRHVLNVIEESSRDALHHMRRMLSVLRVDDDTALVDGADPAESTPVLDLSALPMLAQRAQSVGVTVHLRLGNVKPLTKSLQQSIYHIAQEAVTNVIKHAAPAQCWISIDTSNDRIRVEITDDGPGRNRPQGVPGYGLIGLRERITSHGGTMSAGPNPGGGFVVRAVLPLKASPLHTTGNQADKGGKKTQPPKDV